MNRVIFAAASAAALLVAGAASAQQTQVTINGDVAAKCGVTAAESTVTLPTDLTNGQALVRGAVTQEIATALNGARIIPFCNGNANSVEVRRAVLARAGSTGNGLLGDFAQFVNYNLDASLGGSLMDSTTTAGATTNVGRFGGHNSASSSATWMTFAPAAGASNAQAASGGSDQFATNWGARTDRRLAAGAYQGSVEVVLTPGL